MIYDAKLMASKLERWETYMDSYQLPTWEELPDLELYMDQLISQVRRYLSLFPEDEQNPVITPSIINNYVRPRVMPAPKRKRFIDKRPYKPTWKERLAYGAIVATFFTFTIFFVAPLEIVAGSATSLFPLDSACYCRSPGPDGPH